VCVRRSAPSWDRLYELASGQEGYFTTREASGAGFSSQLLLKHIHAGRVSHVRRGVYRLVHFPAGDHEDLVIVWLWSEKQGVFSHQTALGLHGLSDVLPAKAHLSLPSAWRNRRFRVPPDVVLHHGDVPMRERVWFGAVPATSALRTLNDCAHEQLAPELLRQASREALRRGLVTMNELVDVRRALRGFGGLAA
jgi:predicted transcriptional regulator of viral defense system